MNEAFAARLGFAAAAWLKQRAAPGGPAEGAPAPHATARVLIGRDTRFSGPLLEAAVARGLRAGGTEPVSLGVLPTPAVARAVRQQRAALGVVITASHNPAADNGIKFFGPAGVKLTDDEELAIEAQLPAAPPGSPAPFEAIDVVGDYISATVGMLPPRALTGWRVVLDTANGATCGTSPEVLRQLGAVVIALGDTPDGHNINAGVGSEHPQNLAVKVIAQQAKLGIAHDGDGDRCVLCDEHGSVLDGDEILAVLALHALRRRQLANNTLVVTVQSNLGLDAVVRGAGGRVLRTPVGDRYVIAEMLADGATLGGESSGHIICSDISPTGDGLVAALKVIEVMVSTGRPLSELRKVLRKFPQATTALKVREKKPLDAMPATCGAIATLERELGHQGRVLVRWSGTEPKLRLLVEGPTEGMVKSGLDRLVAAARTELELA